MAQDGTATLEEVVVTAQKQAQDVQKTPIAVTAIAGSDLATQGIRDASELQGVAPSTNFQTTQNNTLNVSIRGITTNNVNIAADPAISYNYDDSPIIHPIGLPPALYDVERVEVLRGPQGTLYGRNSTGGAVNIITAKPSSDYAASARFGAGNYGSREAAGMLNIPLGDKFAVRAVLQHIGHDPYLDDGYSDQNTNTARLHALYRPTDDISVLVSADHTRIKGKGAAFSNCPPGSAAGPAPNYCVGVAWRPYAGNPAIPEIEGNFLDIENTGVRAQFSWDMGLGTLVYIPAYREVTQKSLGLGTTPIRVATFGGNYGVVGFGVDNENRTVTQELRLSSKTDQRLTWVVGAFYVKDEIDISQMNYSNAPFLGAGGLQPHVFTSYVETHETESAAVFGQVSYALMDSLRLTLGGRYTSDQTSVDGDSQLYSTRGVTVVSNDGKQSFNNTSWRVGLEYDVAPASLLYGSISSGYKAGGFNQGLPPNTYPAEEILAYEAGMKNRFLNDTLQINLSAFYYDYDNYQYQYFGVVNTPAGPNQQTVTAPAKKVKIKGGEFEGRWLFTSADTVDLTVALLDAKFETFVLSSGNFSGNDLPFAPDLSITAGYEHRFDLPGGAALTARVQTLYNSDQWAYYAPLAGSRVESYTKSDANLTYTAASKNWSVTGWVRNIEDEAHLNQYLASSVLNSTVGLVSPPRTYGMTIDARF